MGPKITLRKIRPTDVPQMISIQEAIIKKKVSRQWVKMVKDHLRRQEGVGYVASKEGQIIGFVIGEVKGEGFGLEKSGWLEVISIHPRVMGMGIGRTLAERLFAYFKQRGIHDVYTSVLWDAVDMLSFFKSLGFDRSTFINLIKRLD